MSAALEGLTRTQVHLLQEGAKHKDGVVNPDGRTGFERKSRRNAAAGLAAIGMLEPNAHGDFYITPAGRALLSGGDNGTR